MIASDDLLSVVVIVVYEPRAVSTLATYTLGGIIKRMGMSVATGALSQLPRQAS